MAPTGSQRRLGRPRSVESEQAILNATLRILSRSGYAGLTVDAVAAEARASKATIYRRWRTKDHLVLAVLGQMPAIAPTSGVSLEAELLDLFAQFERSMKSSPLRALLPRLAAEAIHDADLAGAMIVVNEQRRVPLRVILNRAVRRGELPANADIELAIDVIQGAVAIRMYFLLDELGETWVRKLVRLVRQGLDEGRSH